MVVEARYRACCSPRHLIKLDGRPLGEFRGTRLATTFHVRLTGRRRWRAKKEGALLSRLTLFDASTGDELASAFRESIFTSDWELRLNAGAARLESAGFFKTGFVVTRDGEALATVDRVNDLGIYGSGWRVRAYSMFGTDLALTDLILVGLTYHTIRRRDVLEGFC